MRGDEVKPFYLLRHVDLTGTSGTGIVAMGAVMPSGQVFMEWVASNHVSWNMFDNIEDVNKINGHDGNTEIIFGNPEEKPIIIKKKHGKTKSS